MTNDKTEVEQPEVISNIVSLMDLRIQKLEENGDYHAILERFDLLSVRFFGGEILDQKEANEFVLYCKYLELNGHSEAMQVRCKQIIEKYLEK